MQPTNYKGVMLCTRPNENNQAPRHTSDGPAPFNSRVHATENLGINPARKVPIPRAKKVKTDDALKRHKEYLSKL